MGDRLVGGLGEVRRAAVPSGRRPVAGLGRHLGAVLGQLDVGRAGLLQLGDAERLADDLGDGVDPLDALVPLGDRLEHPDDVDELVRFLVQLVRPDLAGERDHRRPVEECVGDAR